MTWDSLAWVVALILIILNVRWRMWNKKAKRVVELTREFHEGKIHHFEFRAKIYEENLAGVEKSMIRSFDRMKRARKR